MLGYFVSPIPTILIYIFLLIILVMLLLNFLKMCTVVLVLLYFFRFIMAKIKSPLRPSGYKNYISEIEKLK